jgi:hypothetical protein
VTFAVEVLFPEATRLFQISSFKQDSSCQGSMAARVQRAVGHLAPQNRSSSTDGRGEVALIVGTGPGISAACARLFAEEGMSVAIAAR